MEATTGDGRRHLPDRRPRRSVDLRVGRREPEVGSDPRETADTNGVVAVPRRGTEPMEGTIVGRRQRRTTERTRRRSKTLESTDRPAACFGTWTDGGHEGSDP